MGDRFIVLLRHGEAAGGARFRGAADDPLSAQGWDQLRAAAALEPGLEHVVTSPALRCAEFAHALAAERGLTLEVAAAFAERRFGAWEGRSAAEIPAADLARFWADPAGYDPPAAEPFADFRGRVLAAWDTLALAARGVTLLVTHGGVVRVVLARVLGMDDPAGLRLEVPPACRTRLRLPPAPGLASLVTHAP